MSKTMNTVNERAGSYLRAADTSVIPESFLAALTANESLGDPEAKRFEPAVLGRLVSVILGQRRSYNGVTAGMLLAEYEEADATHSGESPEEFATRQIQRLQDAATSWGFTQIMGYHMLRWDEEISQLTAPTRHYEFTLRLLGECPEDSLRKHGVKVNLSKDFEMMGRWWNTGAPVGKKTYHESYLPNILKRMEEWESMNA